MCLYTCGIVYRVRHGTKVNRHLTRGWEWGIRAHCVRSSVLAVRTFKVRFQGGRDICVNSTSLPSYDRHLTFLLWPYSKGRQMIAKKKIKKKFFYETRKSY